MPGPPIRKPSDHSPPAGSPRNIAGHHVLHRPLMPRHPPNAQKNKQQRHTNKTRKILCRRNLTVRCSRPLYSSQPTHPHPPTTPNNQEPQTGRATRAHCPRTPTACHPHTRRGTHHATLPTQAGSRSMTGVFPTPITRQANHPAHQCTTVGRPAYPREQPPAGPDPCNGPDNQRPGSHPTLNLSLERR